MLLVHYYYCTTLGLFVVAEISSIDGYDGDSELQWRIQSGTVGRGADAAFFLV